VSEMLFGRTQGGFGKDRRHAAQIELLKEFA
jgi:hypothetical protein